MLKFGRCGVLATFAAVGFISVFGYNCRASIIENFSSDPVAAGRFTQATANTESSFTYNGSAGNLSAVLDNDGSLAYYTSTPFAATTKTSDAFFNMAFRVNRYEAKTESRGYFGLMNGLGVNGGDPTASGLLACMLYTNGQLCVQAKILPLNNSTVTGPDKINLTTDTDYVLEGTYKAATRVLTIQIYKEANLIGTSTATLQSYADFSVDRLGFQNYGNKLPDNSTSGSISMTAYNLNTVPEPITLALILVGGCLRRRVTY